jgi:cell division protein FtsN
MEGKKVLWVVFSIALALVVILAAGLFLLRPRQPESSGASGAEARPGGLAAPSLQGYDPYEYVRGSSAPPGLAPPTGTQPTVIVVGEPPPPEGAAAAEPAAPPAPPTLPPPSVAVAPQVAEKPGPSAQPTTPAEQAPQERASGAAAAAKPALPPERAPPERAPQERVPPERAPQERASAGAGAATAARTTGQAAARARPKAVRVTEYWIQAGSFSSASRADEVTRRLEERGLAARTTTRDLNGKTHFRVRVGPYASRAEAEKFLGWIRELKGFETSYISMVASRRSMP